MASTDQDERSLAAVISPKSAWNAAQAARFLHESRLPMRLSTVDAQGYPHVTSLWFLYADGVVLCCTQRSAQVCRHLRHNARVGFEIAVSSPPYRGLSGQAEAALVERDPAVLLQTLIDRYLEGRDASLQRWLMSRIDTEVVIELRPRRVTSWDFGRRMSAAR